jgi:polysaccharide export outer membrane protein
VDVIRLRSQARKDVLDMMETEMSMRRGLLEEQRSNFQARSDLGAEKRDYVYLAGEVTRQNRVALPYAQKAMLADVLYGEGGYPNMSGNPANIYVLRPSQDPAEFGAVTAWHLDMRNAANMTLATRLEMRPNDIIFVEEQPITKWNRVVQQFVPSLLTTPAAIAAN